MSKSFVVLSDLHAHPWSAFAHGDGLQNTRLVRSLEILEASLQRAQDDKIPWVFAGDLVNTAGFALHAVSAGVTEVLYHFPDVEKIVVWGNHDARGIGGKITLDQTIFAALGLAIPMDILDPSILTGSPPIAVNAKVAVGGLTFAGAGYQPHANLLEYGPPADVGIYHQTVAGSIAPNGFELEEGIAASELLSRYRLSIVGHVHHPQQMEAGPGQGILIPGSPEHHNFGDRGDHGWWVVTLEDGAEHDDDCSLRLGSGACDCAANIPDPHLEFIPGGSPKFVTVGSSLWITDPKDFYRIRTLEVGEQLPEGVVVVAPTPTVVKHRDTLQGVSEAEHILQAWLRTVPPPKGELADYLSVGNELLVAQDPPRLRNIQLTSITLTNFCCFADAHLDVKQGLWLLTGQGKDYPSNGAGKSTLIGEALFWLLFGRTTKGLGADDVIRRGTNTCSVTIGLLERDTILTVTRTRGPHGHSLTVLEDVEETTQDVWEATSVTEMTTKLGHYLGITPEIFQNLAYFSQEKLVLFSSATDGERKEVLADLIGLHAYQDAASAATVKIAALEHDAVRYTERTKLLTEAEANHKAEAVKSGLAVRDWKTEHQTRQTRALAEALEIEKENARQHHRTGVRIGQVMRHAADLIDRYKQRQADTVLARITAGEEELAQGYQKKLRELTLQYKEHHRQACRQYASVDAARLAVATLPQLRQDVTALTPKHTQANTRATTAETAVRIAEHDLERVTDDRIRCAAQYKDAQAVLQSGVCPTCAQPVTEAHVEQCLLPLWQELDKLLEEAQVVTDSLDTLKETALNLRARHATVGRKIQTHGDTIDQLEKVAWELNTADALQKEADTQKVSSTNQQLVRARVDAELARELDVYTGRQQERVAHAQRLGESILNYWRLGVATGRRVEEGIAKEINPHQALLTQAADHLVACRTELQETEAASINLLGQKAVYEYWRHGFSRQGLQSLLVEEIAALFNNARSTIFPLLTQGVYDVQFSTLSSTQKGERREKTEFLVFEHGEPVPYSMLSGGQRRRIDIGIMLVLTQAVAQWMGTPGVLGLLILDEVFGFLDASGAEGLLAALGQINEQVPTIYVITHDTHLQSLVPNMIHVEQNAEGISHVRGA